jgi:hypothetical protein
MQDSKANTKVTKNIQFFVYSKWLTVTLMKNCWLLQLSVVKNDWDIWSSCFVDYGDVVTFDTTYRTNRYSMPLAMFVGFNN